VYCPVVEYLVELSTPLQLVLDETVGDSWTFFSMGASPHPAGIYMSTREVNAGGNPVMD